MAEIVIDGRNLHLRDLIVYAAGPEPLSGLTPELLAARRHLKEEARRAGFQTLRITGWRTAGSTSANPGKRVDISADLTRLE